MSTESALVYTIVIFIGANFHIIIHNACKINFRTHNTSSTAHAHWNGHLPGHAQLHIFSLLFFFFLHQEDAFENLCHSNISHYTVVITSTPTLWK